MEIQGYQLPEKLFYEKNHYWVKVEDDMLIMGMDDFAQQLAGDIVFVQIPFAGKKLKVGKKFAQVESGKWLGKVYAPVNGELIEGNEALEAEPSLINNDCYGQGWMFKIKPADMDELNSLIHTREDIEKWVLEDIEKYKQD
ncbi:MAG: glycine cleavage system protein GcvH [Desulfobacteraceae bacterium]|jgi:glycine cleavage system H protein